MPTNYEPLVLTIEPAYIGSAVSPTVDITETSDDVTVTITDINGEHSYTVEKTDQAIADAEAAASAANNAASAASTAATRANTSADNANAATTAANSAAAAATAATVDTEAATAAANSAASSATSAAANANAAADRVDTAIDDAESAATAANSAATSATNAASAANTAASNANAKATLADTAASNANTKAGLANTAANAANSAAQSASSAASTASTAATNADAKATAANNAANAATTAASSANNAAARVDAALETLDDDLKITDSASGESVTAADASYLNALVVNGESIQDGTPTPDNPVPVQVVEGRNIFEAEFTNDAQTVAGLTFAHGVSDFTLSGTATSTYKVFDIANGAEVSGNYTLSFTVSGTCPQMQIAITDSNNVKLATRATGAGTYTVTGTLSNTISKFIIESLTNGAAYDCAVTVQLESGSTATPYAPYGCIGLQTGETVTPIDLQGNVLAGLPDGTKDELEIDSAGNVTIEKCVGVVDLGSLTWEWASTVTANIVRMRSNVISDALKPSANNINANILCSNYVTSNASASYTKTWGISLDISGRIYVYDDSYNTQDSVTSFVSAMSGVLLYYELATPTTIDLGYITPPAIPSGSVITILATLTPTITPTWWTSRAAAIPEALAANKQHIEDTSADDASIAPVESSTAVANHSVGALIMLDGMLYKVTTAIATGEAITPGTNCTQTTVAAELAALA